MFGTLGQKEETQRAGSSGLSASVEEYVQVDILPRTQMTFLVILPESQHLYSDKLVVRTVESREIVTRAKAMQFVRNVKSRDPTVHVADDEFRVDLNRALQFADQTFFCAFPSSTGLLEEHQADLPVGVRRLGQSPLLSKPFRISFWCALSILNFSRCAIRS